MTGAENLVKMVYSIGEASPVIAALRRQASAARALGTTGAGGLNYGLLTFIERVTRILRRISVLQVTPIMDEPLINVQPPEASRVSVAEMRVPAPPEAMSVRVTREGASVDSVIRRIIRRLGFRGQPTEAETAPPSLEKASGVEEIVTGGLKPRTPAMRAAYSVPEYRERVIAAVPPLFTFPTKELGYAETIIEGPPKEELEGQPSTEDGSRPPEDKKPGVSVKPRGASWRPTPKVAHIADMGKRASGLAVSTHAASQPSIQANLVETVFEARFRATEAVVQMMPWAPGGAAMGWAPAVMGSLGAPSSLETGAGRLRFEQLGATAPLLQLIGETRVEKIQDASKLIIEREADRGAASTASQISRLSKRMAEGVAQVYRRSVAEKLPPHERLTAVGLAQTPAVGEAQTRSLQAAAGATALGGAAASMVDERRRARTLIPAMLQLTLMGAQIASASREAQSIASKGLRDISGAVPRLVTAAAELTGFAPMVLSGDLGATPGLTFRDVLARVTTAGFDAEATVSESVNQMAMALKVGPIGVQQVERVALEAPLPTPGMRLREALPALSGEKWRRESAAPPTLERPRPTYEKPRPIDIKMESPEDMDLRELKRKIARILRDEARRYGVR